MRVTNLESVSIHANCHSVEHHYTDTTLTVPICVDNPFTPPVLLYSQCFSHSSDRDAVDVLHRDYVSVSSI